MSLQEEAKNFVLPPPPEAQHQPGLLPQRELGLPADHQRAGDDGGCSVPAWQDGDLDASEDQGGSESGRGETEESSALQELLQPPGPLHIPARSARLLQCGPLSLVEDLHYCALIGRVLP